MVIYDYFTGLPSVKRRRTNLRNRNFFNRNRRLKPASLMLYRLPANLSKILQPRRNLSFLLTSSRWKSNEKLAKACCEPPILRLGG